ncbi:MAG: hypothetical protein GXP13_08885 [Gammaproteobacteria bacterium]|nr:hypothetical protein [Gammaproteobacteria bacterium]
MRKTVYWSGILLIGLLAACGGGNEVRGVQGEKASRINVELGITYLRQGKYKIANGQTIESGASG